MGKRHRFSPDGWEGLEARQVLSAGIRTAAAQIKALNEQGVATGPQAQRANLLISHAFDQFRADYFASLNVYLTPPNNTMAGMTAFANATTQLVDGLGQKVISVF